jgi:signal transduction histidine kinase
MWDNPEVFLPNPIPSHWNAEVASLVIRYDPSEQNTPEKGGNALKRILAESAADELTRQLADPFQSEPTDLVEIVSRSVTVLSTMAAELGVILRLQIRTQRVSAGVDEEKIRRAINALVVHLLTVSQMEGWVTISLEDLALDGRRGFSLLLTAEKVILPFKTNPEYEEELTTQADLSVCRKIIEKHGGVLTVRVQDGSKLTYSVWLPA